MHCGSPYHPGAARAHLLRRWHTSRSCARGTSQDNHSSLCICDANCCTLRPTLPSPKTYHHIIALNIVFFSLNFVLFVVAVLISPLFTPFSNTNQRGDKSRRGRIKMCCFCCCCSSYHWVPFRGKINVKCLRGDSAVLANLLGACPPNALRCNLCWQRASECSGPERAPGRLSGSLSGMQN